MRTLTILLTAIFFVGPIAAEQLCHRLSRQQKTFQDFQASLGTGVLSTEAYNAAKSQVNTDLSAKLKEVITACRSEGSTALRAKCETSYNALRDLSAAPQNTFKSRLGVLAGSLASATSTCKAQ